MTMSRPSSALCARLALLGAAWLLVGSCVRVRNPVLRSPSAPLDTVRTDATLKIHYRSGALDVLRSWDREGDSVILGLARRWDAERRPLESVFVRVRLDTVALLETNAPLTVGSFGEGVIDAFLVLGTVATVGCVSDPKSCFGSCPTFYLDANPAARPLAEGFSSSIARRLEAHDVDDLQTSRAGGSLVPLLMRNEALESHAVRYVRLLAVPTPPQGEVFATPDGTIIGVQEVQTVSRCRNGLVDCVREVAARDAREWHTPTDSADLAAPDTVHVTFTAAPGTPVLLMAARQAFVSTFVLYQTMATLGTTAGSWLAKLERGDPDARRPLDETNRLIGEIAIDVQDADGMWHPAGRYAEAGPIATDVQAIPLPPIARPRGAALQLRLRFARGNWRIGYLALGTLGDTLTPVVLDPRTATLETGATYRGARPPRSDVRDILVDTTRVLFTQPGDAVQLSYRLPTDASTYRLFIDSRGWYREWMRREWLAEENAALSAWVMTDPRAALRLLAPTFKAREAGFEQRFWNSRFGRGTP
ncbi:MAG: hypothetical protein K2R93_07600 [Gemmatimonadaceae bacterium]|nr:hypothetical protein [Gemmatimonadaceae bacterium]